MNMNGTMKSDFKRIPRSLTSNVPLAPFTTFGIGGPARFFIEAHTNSEIEEAITLARERSLPLYTIGAGSNGMAPMPVEMFGRMVYQNVPVNIDEESLKKIAEMSAPREKGRPVSMLNPIAAPISSASAVDIHAPIALQRTALLAQGLKCVDAASERQSPVAIPR